MAEKPFRFLFFLPDARLLDDNEIANLPAAKRQDMEAGGKGGLWLEVRCPDRSCIDDDGRITLPAKPSADERGTFLNLFCPEGTCEIAESTDLP